MYQRAAANERDAEAGKAAAYGTPSAIGGPGSDGGAGGGADAAEPPPVPVRAAMRACCGEARTALPPALRSSFTSRYLAANLVYCAYAFLIVWIDTVAQPNADATRGGRANRLRAYQIVYDLYKVSGILHGVNAFQYAWAWLPLGVSWLSPLMIPEYLNMIGAGMYTWTAYQYEK